MRSLLLLAALLPTLASAQFTRQQVNGLSQSIQLAVQSVAQGTPPAFPTATRLTFGITVTPAHIAAGAVAIRCTILLTPAQGRFLTIPDAYFAADPSRYYAVMQVVGVPTATDFPVPEWLSDLLQTCSPNPITPAVGWSQVTIAAADDPQAQSVVTGWTHACSTGPTCEWRTTLPDGSDGPWAVAPRNLTLAPGRWRGAGCRLKPQVELFGRETTMPLDCK